MATKGAKKDMKHFLHEMVESMIKGDSDEAVSQLSSYLELKTRSMILGEKEEEEDEKDPEHEKKESKEEEKKERKSGKEDEDDDDDDDDESEEKDDDDDDDDDDKMKGKKKVKESFHKSNDTKARANIEKHSNLGDTSTKGNSLRDKPHKSNDTKARAGLDKHANHGDTSVKDYDDGRDYEMGTGNV